MSVEEKSFLPEFKAFITKYAEKDSSDPKGCDDKSKDKKDKTEDEESKKLTVDSVMKEFKKLEPKPLDKESQLFDKIAESFDSSKVDSNSSVEKIVSDFVKNASDFGVSELDEYLVKAAKENIKHLEMLDMFEPDFTIDYDRAIQNIERLEKKAGFMDSIIPFFKKNQGMLPAILAGLMGVGGAQKNPLLGLIMAALGGVGGHYGQKYLFDQMGEDSPPTGDDNGGSGKPVPKPDPEPDPKPDPKPEPKPEPLPPPAGMKKNPMSSTFNGDDIVDVDF